MDHPASHRRLIRAAVPVLAAAVLATACSSETSGRGSGSNPGSTTPASTSAVAAPSSSPMSPTPSARPTTHRAPSTSATPQATTRAPKPAPRPSHHTAPHTTHHTTHHAAAALPLHLPTADAKQVVTVVASGHSATTATLQRWSKSGGSWHKVGGGVTAHLGADGVGQASESSSKTPSGSFTLTEAFGHDSNPGTALPYTRTTPDDWWISQPGKLYNTRQRCASDCGFTRGDPNEHLYYETPYYNHAVVIDYNTRNAPGGVHQGAGSAFFLHVTDGKPTAGCVAIPGGDLESVLRWLQPSDHPRIMIGVK